MTDTTQTNENTQPTPEEMQAELERLRAHSAELLADLKTERKAHNQTKTELQNALGGESATWKQRYHQEAVLAPLERELAGLTPLPINYLQDVCKGMGLLKMAADSEGIERPQWIDLEGNPADLKQGLYGFLASMCDAAPDSELPKVLRSSGMSGSGAMGSHGGGNDPSQPEKENQPPTQPAAYGLR